MKRNILIAALFTASVLATSCSGGSSVNEVEELKTISLEPLVGSEQVVRLSEIASKVEYIPPAQILKTKFLALLQFTN